MATDFDNNSVIENEDVDSHSDDINFDNLRSDSKYITKDQINDFFSPIDHASFNFLHINCRSLKKALDQLQIY